MTDAFDDAARLRDLLKGWALSTAFPLWWKVGADHKNGGFFETIEQSGEAKDSPRRGRVLPRQIYAFSTAGELGWTGPWYVTSAISREGTWPIMQAIMAGVPIVSAGWFEAKNDINARLAYRKLAVDLRTERPTPAQITKAIGTVTGDPTYRTNIAKVAAELRAATPVDTVVDAILADRL